MANYLNLFVTRKYSVKDEPQEKTEYTKVGVLYPHKKGEGFSVVITEGLSVSGSLVAFPPAENSEAEAA